MAMPDRQRRASPFCGTCAALLLALGLLALPGPLAAHPHVFVDGGVDFVFGPGGMLEALDVTWLYDPFETLYLLSSAGLTLSTAGTLAEADRQELIRRESAWADDFEGASHPEIGGTPIRLGRPTDFDAQMQDGRLLVTFRRRLDRPVAISGQTLDLAFYEETYFYAFAVSDAPLLKGQPPACSTRVVPFDSDTRTAELKATLAELGREETPGIADVGRLFADRILVTCD